MTVLTPEQQRDIEILASLGKAAEALAIAAKETGLPIETVAEFIIGLAKRKA